MKRYIQTLKNPKSFKNNEWTHEIEERDVFLLTTYKQYAMVRRPRCMPYVCELKDLRVNTYSKPKAKG